MLSFLAGHTWLHFPIPKRTSDLGQASSAGSVQIPAMALLEDAPGASRVRGATMLVLDSSVFRRENVAKMEAVGIAKLVAPTT